MVIENKLINIEEWVDDAIGREADYRACVHILLKAISINYELASNMIMKGGSLLALRYKSKRYTTDIDFSTELKFDENKIKAFLEMLSDSLERSRVTLGYSQLKCILQSHVVKPRVKASFPTLQIKIGYANTNTQKELERLYKGESTHVVRIDYSFNEKTYNTEKIHLSNEEDNYIIVYSIHDIIAEKYRALIQQKIRKRNRFQDVYDLDFLIHNHLENLDEYDKRLILLSMKEKFKNRKIAHLLDAGMLNNKEIRERSRANYSAIADTVSGKVPKFEDAYNRVSNFLFELPWGIIYSSEE